jgi:hypothetical protein
MNRRSWFGRLVAGTLALVLWPRRLVPGQEAKEQASLEERLKSGLKCRRQEEFAFVALVAEKARTGELPEALLLQTMRWAIKRNPKFPFFYFQFAVTKQADALGVALQ